MTKLHIKKSNILSLDLSAALNIVNIKFLVKRLNIIGLPQDILDLIRGWLNDRLCFVTIIAFDLDWSRAIRFSAYMSLGCANSNVINHGASYNASMTLFYWKIIYK